jgi:hypothetical protein
MASRVRKFAAALVVTVMFLVGGLATPAPSSKVPTTVLNSIVRLQLPGGDTYCTGFVINQVKRFIMTADHCLGGNPPIVIRRQFAREVFHLPHMDASVLEILPGDPLPPALKPDVGEMVLNQPATSFGYAEGKGLKRIDLFVVFPKIMLPGADGSFVLMSPNLIAGMSGGPILSEKGVVGINMAGRDDPDLSVMRPIGPIYELTKDYWELGNSAQ